MCVSTKAAEYICIGCGKIINPSFLMNVNQNLVYMHETEPLNPCLSNGCTVAVLTYQAVIKIKMCVHMVG